MKKIICLFLLFNTLLLSAQDKTQTIRGQVIDKDNQQPLVGATITLVNSLPLMGVLTDANGDFLLEHVPLGRQIIECTFIGYAPFKSEAFILNSIKEGVFRIEMKESATEMNTVIVSSSHNTNAPLNELSVVSSRSFSVEETERIPAGVNDPGRMALSFSGVQQGKDDSENEILIRGNSSFGLLWRLEGIDIPAPNHFARAGSSGGGITVFSAQVLSRSDFSTGGFPAEYGNAISGVMDVHFRKGNTDKREYRAKIGLLGLEFATEGPLPTASGQVIKKDSLTHKSPSSYLVNYRYSTLGVLNKLGFYVVGERISNDFQDISFNIALNGKNKKTTHTLFGIAGLSSEYDAPVANPTDRKIGVANNWQDLKLGSNMGTIGWTMTHSIDEKTYLKSVVALMSNYIFRAYDTLNLKDERYRYNTQNYYDTRLAATLTYNRKINADLRFKGGIIAQQVFYKYDKTINARPTSRDINERTNQVAQAGSTNFQMLQLYGQYNYQANNNLTLNGGVHVLYLWLNNTPSVEPRFSMKYQMTSKQTIGLAYGLHGQVLPFSVYIFQQRDTVGGVVKTSTPNHDAKMIQSHHLILSYNLYTDNGWKLSVEPYLQRLIHVPIEPTVGSLYWMLNDQGNVPDFKVVSQGKGLNYGIDVSLERFFSNKFYFLMNVSTFKSSFEVLNKEIRNSRLNTAFGSSLTLGREFTLKNKATLQLGTRVILNGGFRYSPLDVSASAKKGQYIPLAGAEWTKQAAPYFRIDPRVAYRFNKNKYAGSISLDIQNVTNHRNISSLAYNPVTNALYSSLQPGSFTPVMSFQYDF
jgi:CarboxypepD_reg-like domain